MIADLLPSLPTEPQSGRVWIQTAASTDDGDPGAILEGDFVVEYGEVVLTIDKQPPVRRALLGRDPYVVARELLREAAKESKFGQRLRYPNLEIV